ncbi:hypothetical protein SAMN05421874_1282 [Nonomuraea maritima]|uniref:Transposase n=1 Tax=Nonomuraea maritima TaxID=683260 RepID=A0A1G9MDZ8_9ACTN|nr:hypothetical protein SAMN05421874_1282 [Nonomuraea maritima]
MSVWLGPNSILVEVIQLDTRALMKVTQRVHGRRYLIGYCATIGELTRHVDLAELVEVIAFPG